MKTNAWKTCQYLQRTDLYLSNERLVWHEDVDQTGQGGVAGIIDDNFIRILHEF